MNRLRFYVWFGALIFLANGWLCYVFSSWKISSSDHPPIWQNALTEIALLSQLPALPLSKVVADFFDLSYPGWAITNSVISILIYFPLIHLRNPWRPRKRAHSIYHRVTDFSSSLNPCGSARKNHTSSTVPNDTNSLSHSEKHA